jgi:hypothetical protein
MQPLSSVPVRAPTLLRSDLPEHVALAASRGWGEQGTCFGCALAVPYAGHIDSMFEGGAQLQRCTYQDDAVAPGSAACRHYHPLWKP